MAAGTNTFNPAFVQEIRACLDKLVSTPGFRSKRRADLVRYLVEETLAGREISEYGIGLDVLQRPESFDPRVDSTVRSEMTRLRRSLADYYEREGASDPWRLEIPARGYAPAFAPAGAKTVETKAAATRRALPAAAWAVMVGLAIVAIAAWAIFARTARAENPSIAVLPFANLTGDPANEYFSDGLTDELIDALARVKGLRVIARSSTFQFKGKAADVSEIGRKLDVVHILEGSVERSGDRIRIVAHLERAADNSHEWSNTYERQGGDLFAVQSELVTGIARNLKAAAGLPSGAGHVPNEEAHRLLMEARYETQQATKESIARAKADCEHAIALDPGYAAAYDGLGSAVFNEANARGTRQTDSERKTAEQLFRKAIELDPELPGPHAKLALLAMTYAWDWNRAEQELTLALTKGSDLNAESYYAMLLIYHGRFSDAEGHLQRALTMDPFGIGTLLNTGLARNWEGRFAEYRELSERMATLAPAALVPKIGIAMSYISEGHPELALPDLQTLKERYPPAAFFEAMAQARMGRREEALRLIRPFEDQYPNVDAPMQWFALVYAFLGDEAETVKWLERSADRREQQALNLAVLPVYAPMRNSPRFRALKKRMGLDQ